MPSTPTLSTVALAAALAMLPLAPSPAAQQEPVFRTGTRTVPVYVTVTDAEGRLVPDLVQDDFEIYDNGKLQAISIFASDIQPIMVVMMLDRSGSIARAAARATVDSVGVDGISLGRLHHLRAAA